MRKTRLFQAIVLLGGALSAPAGVTVAAVALPASACTGDDGLWAHVDIGGWAHVDLGVWAHVDLNWAHVDIGNFDLDFAQPIDGGSED
jgi:hypothetical protein